MDLSSTLVIALWGAILSTVLAVRQIWIDRLNIKVSAWTEAHKISDRPMSHLLSVVVRVENKGRRPLQILEVAYAHSRQRPVRAISRDMLWRNQSTTHANARNRIDLPFVVEPGGRVDIPVWAIADDWPPGNGRMDLWAGVRSANKSWITPVDSDTRVTG